MRYQFILAGVGGQGILFATKVLAETAVRLGLTTIGSETHGMSQRGGSVISHLKIGGFSSPLVMRGSADVVLAFEATEAYRSLPFLRSATAKREGGTLFVNCRSADDLAPAILDVLERHGIGVHAYDARAAAADLGSPLVANLILLGHAAAAGSFPFDLDQLCATVESISPNRFLDQNLAALRVSHPVIT